MIVIGVCETREILNTAVADWELNETDGWQGMTRYLSCFSVRRFRCSARGRIHDVVRDVPAKRLDRQVVIVAMNFNRLHKSARVLFPFSNRIV